MQQTSGDGEWSSQNAIIKITKMWKGIQQNQFQILFQQVNILMLSHCPFFSFHQKYIVHKKTLFFRKIVAINIPTGSVNCNNTNYTHKTHVPKGS